jgi:hypothetical protein
MFDSTWSRALAIAALCIVAMAKVPAGTSIDWSGKRPTVVEWSLHSDAQQPYKLLVLEILHDAKPVRHMRSLVHGKLHLDIFGGLAEG